MIVAVVSRGGLQTLQANYNRVGPKVIEVDKQNNNDNTPNDLAAAAMTDY